MRMRLNQSGGFSLIETLIVVVTISVIATFVMSNLNAARESAYLAKATKEMRSVSEALELYRDSNGGNYPPDADREIPSGIEPYLSGGSWSEAAWPGSVFDWDNWFDPDTGERIYQVSVRFCPYGDPDNCRFPKKEWAENFDYHSGVYYCISGECRAHIDRPIDHPAYCVNCNNN